MVPGLVSAQSLHCLHTNRHISACQSWLMDVSDPSSSIERPQDVWAGGPPDSAKMEAKGIQDLGKASGTWASGRNLPKSSGQQLMEAALSPACSKG